MQLFNLKFPVDKGPAEVEDENEGEAPADGVHFFPSSGEGFQKGIGDESEGKAFVDAEGEGDREEGEEGRDRLGPVAPGDLLGDAGHEESDRDQRRGRREEGARGDEGVEK